MVVSGQEIRGRWLDALTVIGDFLQVAQEVDDYEKLTGEVSITQIDRLACMHCVRCAVLDRLEDRHAACFERHPIRPECGIRSIEQWRILDGLMRKVLTELTDRRFSHETLGLLNTGLIVERAVFPRLILDRQGLVSQGYYTDTLAGRLLLALLTLVAYRSGDVLHVNVSDMPVSDARRQADVAKRFHRHLEQDRLRSMDAQTSTRSTAQAEGRARATIRKYRGARLLREPRPDADERW